MANGRYLEYKKPRYRGKIEKPRYFCNGMTDRHEIWHDIFAKYGTLRDHVLLRTTTLSNWNKKLIHDINGRHVENYHNVTITLPTVRFT